MTYEEKKSLYEKIMKEVSRNLKTILESAQTSDSQIVVFTGKSKYFEGDKVEKFIEKNTDFKTSHTVNDKTYLIITGEKPGPNKLAKAEELGIPTTTEDTFYKRYNLIDKLP